MDLIIELIGWGAAGVMLGAYALLSRGKLSGQGSWYQTLNVVGSLLVGINSFTHGAWPSVSVNVVWLVIGVITLTASNHGGGGTRATDDAEACPPQHSDTVEATPERVFAR